jgi:hypothetical protein
VVAALATAAKGELVGATTFVLALFGLVVVLGLITYSVRNDQFYDELVGRAADIERSLGIRDGSYGFRPRAWLHLSLGPLGWSLNHGNALLLIYGATVTIWLTVVLLAFALATAMTIRQHARMRRRAAFHTAPENTARYLPQQSDRQFAAHLIAALSDLPPRWILDSESGRRA